MLGSGETAKIPPGLDLWHLMLTNRIDNTVYSGVCSRFETSDSWTCPESYVEACEKKRRRYYPFTIVTTHTLMTGYN